MKLQPEYSYHKPEPKAPPDVLTMNVLEFAHPAENKVFNFTMPEEDGKYRFRIDKLPEGSGDMFTGINKDKPFVYTDFSSTGNGVQIGIDLKKCPAIAKAYYTYLIRRHLVTAAGVIATNFLYDTQFWYNSPGTTGNGLHTYEKFTVRVLTGSRNRHPAILITYDGRAYVLKASVQELVAQYNIDVSAISKVVFRKQVYPYDKLPVAAKYHQEEVYPLLNRKLGALLRINTPVKINGKLYKSIYDNISWFFENYINEPGFKAIIPHGGKWKRFENIEQYRIGDTGREIALGEGKSSNSAYNGLNLFGPYRLPEAGNIRVMMVYTGGDEQLAATLEKLLNKATGFPDMRKLTRLNYYVDRELDIVVPEGHDIVNYVGSRLRMLEMHGNTTYYAFYISPYTRFVQDTPSRRVYYQVKERFLSRGIALQVIEREKLSRDFSYSMANIGIAMIAKLGGVPWRLKSQTEQELVIGFSAYRSQFYKTKYIGSSVCFTNDGVFREMDCFPSDELWSISGMAEKALIRYRENNPGVKRMVIHFYKRMSYKELKPIMEMLERLNFDIPVIIVSISKTISREFLVFDEGFEGKMPLNGSYFSLGENRYLFCNNARQNKQDSPLKLPLPLKIELQSSHETELKDPILVEKLIRQVYEFSFMHWRSVNQPTIPVTLSYPEMIARMVPWFDEKRLNDYGRNSMWFL